jgi:hypothetical protein
MDTSGIFRIFISGYICVIYQNMNMAAVRTCEDGEDGNTVGASGKRFI